MFKIKLTGEMRGISEADAVLAETYLDHLDADFARMTLRNVSECMLYEIVRLAEKEIKRRETIKYLNAKLADVVQCAVKNDIDIIDAETGEVLTDKHLFLG